MRVLFGLLLRSLLAMAFGALMVVTAQKLGPTYFAKALPQDIRPTQEEVDAMTTERMIDALREIRRALE